MPYSAATVADTIDRINRSYFLPAIQRPFVWTGDQIVALFDSLMKGYPISSFLFWNVAPENRSHWQVYKFTENFRFGEVHIEIAEPDGREVTLVLDGQQRLTSLLIGLRGTLTVKAKNKRWDSPSAWQRRRLYLDLLTDPAELSPNNQEETEEPPETSFGFHFLENPPTSAPGRAWMKVGDILDCGDDENFRYYKQNLIHKLPETSSRLDEKTVARHLDRLRTVVWEEKSVCFYTENDQDYDRVLRIFVRANDAGTKLSKSDLMLATISSKWTDIPAREEIYSFVETLNTRLDRKNDVSKDFVMKSCLLLSDLDHVYQVKNFTNHNLEIMRANWPRIKQALRRTLMLVNRFGIDADNLTSLNALLPIAYYLNVIDVDLLEGSTPFHARNAERIRRWLIASLLNGVFGGNSDSTIGIARNTVSGALESGREFPLVELYAALSKHRKRPVSITSETVRDAINIRYGQKGTFLLLSLLYDERSWGAIPHEVDHIFPRSRVNRKSLMGLNVPASRIDLMLECVDRVGNLQLIAAHDNASKNDQRVRRLDTSARRRVCRSPSDP